MKKIILASIAFGLTLSSGLWAAKPSVPLGRVSILAEGELTLLQLRAVYEHAAKGKRHADRSGHVTFTSPPVKVAVAPLGGGKTTVVPITNLTLKLHAREFANPRIRPTGTGKANHRIPSPSNLNKKILLEYGNLEVAIRQGAGSPKKFVEASILPIFKRRPSMATSLALLIDGNLAVTETNVSVKWPTGKVVTHTLEGYFAPFIRSALRQVLETALGHRPL